GQTRLQGRRRNPCRTNRYDGVDIGGRKISPRDRLARDANKQGFRPLQKSLGAFRPTTRLKVPFDWLGAVAIANSRIRKQARQCVELGVAVRQQPARGREDLLLVELVGWNRGRQ